MRGLNKRNLNDRSISGIRRVRLPHVGGYVMAGRLTVAASVAVICLASGPKVAAATACAELATLSLPETTVTAALEVQAGNYTPPQGPAQADLPAFCRVALTVAPQIHIEIWLPKDTWNGRYRGEGGGGYAGQISYGGLAAGIRAGYATASTDTGHPASAGGTFALNPDGSLNTQLISDFAERSLREMVLKAKAVIAAHYGKPPAYSYGNGCSTGGRQGLVAAALSRRIRRSCHCRTGHQLGSVHSCGTLAADRHEQDSGRTNQRHEAGGGDRGGGRRVRCQ